MCRFCKRRTNIKLSEYIEKYGDCEVTDEIDKCIVKAPKTVYDLKCGDRYFFLTASGIVPEGTWSDDDSDFDRRRIGNMFLTKEEAKFAKERLKVIAELKKYAKEFSDEEWMNQSIEKHYIIFDYENHVIEIGYVCYLKGNDIHFESEEKAREAIKWVGEDRVKKYYLGVKE